MNATKLALLMLSLALLASTPVQAEGETETETEDDPCPVVQTMLRDPYVSVHPYCIGETVGWAQRQV